MPANQAKPDSTATLSLVSQLPDDKKPLAADCEIKQLKRLTEASMLIHSTLDSEQVMRHLVDAADQLVEAEKCGAGLVINDAVVFTKGKCNGEWIDVSLQFAKGVGVAGHIWKTQQPYINNQPFEDPDIKSGLYKKLGCRNALAVPILTNDGRYLGCFELHNKKNNLHFSPRDTALLKHLAVYAALALENSRLHTEQKAATESLQNFSERYQQMFQNNMAVKLLLDTRSGKIIDANQAAKRFYGFDTLTNMTIADLEEPRPTGQQSPLADCSNLANDVLNGDSHITTRHRCADGTIKSVTIGVSPVTISGRERLFAVVLDATERLQVKTALAESQHMTQAILANVCEGVVHFDSDGTLLFVNRAAEEMLGYTQAEVLGSSVFGFIYIEDADDPACPGRVAIDEITAVLAGADAIHANNVGATSRDGSVVQVEFRCAATRNQAGEVSGCVVTFSDIRDRLEQESHIRKLAYSDSLTGLPNRLALQNRLKKLLADGRKTGRVGAMLFWDVDNFKTINDSLGHAIGDEMLKEIATRASQCVSKTDIVARHGGDEFVVMTGQLVDDSDAAIGSARKLASILQTRLAEPYSIGGHLLHGSVSVGIAPFGGEYGLGSDDVIRQADTAMYAAKRLGRSKVCEFEPSMHHAVKNRLILEGELRQALKHGEMTANYQPKVGVNSQIICGAEVLMRWHHPTRGIIMPDEFLPTAEDTGLMPELGETIFDTVFQQLVDWQKAGLTPVPMAINLSAAQFNQPQLAVHLSEKLRRYGLAGSLLELEITETTLMTNPEQVRMNMLALRQIGVRISVDDFGTGYSSLNYLKKFPIDTVKIDRTFVDDIPLDPDDRAITSAIISMSKALQLKTIAEGVETEAQLGYLQGLGCDQYQGWLQSNAGR